MARAKKQSNPIVKAFNKNSGERVSSKDSTIYSKDSFGDSNYGENSSKTKEYIQISRKTIIPGVIKLTGKVYEVPKGSMNTAKAERARNESRNTNLDKRKAQASKPKKLY